MIILVECLQLVSAGCQMGKEFIEGDTVRKIKNIFQLENIKKN